MAQGDFAGALQRIKMDPALKTEATMATLVKLAQAVKGRQQAQAQEEALALQAAAEAAKAKLAALAQGLAGDLLKGDTPALTQRLKEAQADPDLSMVTNEASELGNLARQAAGWPEKLVKSFEENRGKSVKIEFTDGRTETLMVTGINGEKIHGQRKVSAGFVGRDFSITGLSAGEKLKRLGDNSEASVKLMRGLVMVRCANDWAAAEPEFAAGGPLGAALIQQAPPRAMPAEVTTADAVGTANAVGTADAKSQGVDSMQQKKTTASKAVAHKTMGTKERQALRALLNLLKLADVTDDPSDVQAVADTIRRKEFSPHAAAKIKEAIIDFYKNHAQTEIARENAQIIYALAHASHMLPPGQRPFRQMLHRGW